jgi:hypothetical protein
MLLLSTWVALDGSTRANSRSAPMKLLKGPNLRFTASKIVLFSRKRGSSTASPLDV